MAKTPPACRRGFVINSWISSAARSYATFWGNMQRKSVLQLLRIIAWCGIYGGLLMPLVFLPVVIFPFVFSKLIAFQILIGLTFPAYLLLAYLEPAYRPAKHLLLGAISAYFVALLLSVLFAVDPSRAWWGNQERMNGLFTLLHFFAWLTMTVSLVRTERQWIKLLQYEVVLSVVMACVAILQKPFPTLLIFKAGERVGGLLDNPIYMATYQIFNLFFILYLWTRTKTVGVKVWLAIAAALDVLALIFAESRGGLIGLIVGLVVFVVIRGLTMRDKRTRNGTIAFIIALIGGYGLLFAFRQSPLIVNTPFHRLVSITAAGGTETRLIAWKIAWQGFVERPVFGWGLDDFHILFNEKYNPQSMRFSLSETWFDRSHNTVFDMLSMTGIVGTIAFFGVFVCLFLTLYRAYKRKAVSPHDFALLAGLPVAYFVQNLFVFDHPAAFSMSFLMYALIIAVTRPGFREGDPAEALIGKPRAFSTVVTVVTVLFFALVVWRCSMLPFQASKEAIQANNYFSANLIPQAHASALAASERKTVYLDEQTFLLIRNLVPIVANGSIKTYPKYKELIDLAKSLLEEENTRHPRNAYTIYLAARFYQETARFFPEDAATAEKLFRQAIALSPKRQQFWYSLADFYDRSNRIQESVDIQKDLLSFDPDQGQPYWTYGLTLINSLNQRKEGIEMMHKALATRYPYQPTNVQEVLQTFEVNHEMGDTAGIEKIPGYLERITPAANQLSSFLQLAKVLDQVGATSTRDQVIEYMTKNVNPNARALYNGETETAIPIKQVAPPTPAITTTSTTITPPPNANPVIKGAGPRR